MTEVELEVAGADGEYLRVTNVRGEPDTLHFTIVAPDWVGPPGIKVHLRLPLGHQPGESLKLIARAPPQRATGGGGDTKDKASLVGRFLTSYGQTLASSNAQAGKGEPTKAVVTEKTLVKEQTAPVTPVAPVFKEHSRNTLLAAKPPSVKGPDDFSMKPPNGGPIYEPYPQKWTGASHSALSENKNASINRSNQGVGRGEADGNWRRQPLLPLPNNGNANCPSPKKQKPAEAGKLALPSNLPGHTGPPSKPTLYSKPAAMPGTEAPEKTPHGHGTENHPPVPPEHKLRAALFSDQPQSVKALGLGRGRAVSRH